LPLTDRWLRQQWPERARDVQEAFLYLRAEGYAPARSQPFTFLPDSLPDAAPVRVAFTGASATVSRGRTATLQLRLPPASTRSITFVQADNTPAADLPVTAWMYWSSSNHCGTLGGADSLTTTRTDANGRISVPAGDIEYALVIGDPHWIFEERRGQNLFRGRLIRRLPEPDTRLGVHRMSQVDVELRITRAGTPVPGLILRAALADCACGACEGPLGTSDGNGRVQIAAFAAEAWSRMELVDAAGIVLWRGNSVDWQRGGVIEIVLAG
jgi:hypothetical protein